MYFDTSLKTSLVRWEIFVFLRKDFSSERIVMRRESAKKTTQVEEKKSTTFIHLVPVCLPSGTGGPRHNIPLYSLVLRQTPAKIRPEDIAFRVLHHRTISAPLTPTASTPFLSSPPYSHCLFHYNLTRDLTKMHQIFGTRYNLSWYSFCTKTNFFFDNFQKYSFRISQTSPRRNKDNTQRFTFSVLCGCLPHNDIFKLDGQPSQTSNGH
jgi:hypothetical protein